MLAEEPRRRSGLKLVIDCLPLAEHRTTAVSWARDFLAALEACRTDAGTRLVARRRA